MTRSYSETSTVTIWMIMKFSIRPIISVRVVNKMLREDLPPNIGKRAGGMMEKWSIKKWKG